MIMVYFGICYFRPDLIPPQYNLLPQQTVQTINQVLGAKDVKVIEHTAGRIADYVWSLPVVQSLAQEATKRVNREIEKAAEKPREQIEEVKQDVRETVCEEWLK